MSEHLDRLEKLTDTLPPLDKLVSDTRGHVTNYEVPKGTCIAFGLFKKKNVAVARYFLSNGTEFPNHSHSEHEWLIIYRGRIQLNMRDTQKICGEADWIYFPPDTAHSAIAIEDTDLIAVTIPAGKGYPDAR